MTGCQMEKGHWLHQLSYLFLQNIQSIKTFKDIKDHLSIAEFLIQIIFAIPLAKTSFSIYDLMRRF